MVEAFKATLEEVVQADLLLHVVDISHPQAEEQIAAVNSVIKEFGAEGKPVLMVFNKMDKLNGGGALNRLQDKFPHAVGISATTGEGISHLRDELGTQLRPSREPGIKNPARAIRRNRAPAQSRAGHRAALQRQDRAIQGAHSAASSGGVRAVRGGMKVEGNLACLTARQDCWDNTEPVAIGVHHIVIPGVQLDIVDRAIERAWTPPCWCRALTPSSG